LFLIWAIKRWRIKGLQHWAPNISWDLRNITGFGERNAFTIPCANSRHEVATNRACKSPILLIEEIARRNKVFKVRKPLFFLKPLQWARREPMPDPQVQWSNPKPVL